MQAAAPRDEAAPNGGGDPKNQEWAQERITRLLGRVQASYGDDLERLVTLTWRVMAACNGDHAAADAGMSSDDARHPVKRLVLDAKDARGSRLEGNVQLPWGWLLEPSFEGLVAFIGSRHCSRKAYFSTEKLAFECKFHI